LVLAAGVSTTTEWKGLAFVFRTTLDWASRGRSPGRGVLGKWRWPHELHRWTCALFDGRRDALRGRADARPRPATPSVFRDDAWGRSFRSAKQRGSPAGAIHIVRSARIKLLK